MLRPMSEYGVDYARQPVGDEPDAEEGLTLTGLNEFLGDIRYQPSWRIAANIEADYYDGNQLTPKEVADLQARGLPLVIENIIAPTINLMLGMEARNRSDWQVKPEKDHRDIQVADALSNKLFQASSSARADRGCADAYASQIKVGLGWVYVGRNPDPFDRNRFVCEAVDRREIWWDWRSKKPDLKDSRYLIRRKWYDYDHVRAMIPNLVQPDQVDETLELAKGCIGQWSGFDPQITMGPTSSLLQNAANLERDWGWDDIEWRDAVRKRLCMYEVWYRVFTRGYVLDIPGGRTVEFDQKNFMHVAAVLSGKVKPRSTMLNKVRMSWWMGPHRLMDIASPLPHNKFPYTPFWGYREDQTGVPYGMIRAMLPLQNEVNRRRAKMLWQLSSVRVFYDADAIDDPDRMMNEVARPDASIELNPERKNKTWKGIEVQDNAAVAQQQFEVYSASKQAIRDVSGVQLPELGAAKPGQSGVAIDRLVDQGITVAAEINDNYRFGRQQVGEQLLAFIVQDMTGSQEQVSIPQQAGRPPKQIDLNVPKVDEETGLKYLDNDVQRAMLYVHLGEVPNTTSYRQQTSMQMTELVKSLPPAMQQLLVDMVVESWDMPFKDEMASRIRKFNGQVPSDLSNLTPEEIEQIKGAQAQAAKQQQMAEAAANLELQKKAGEVAEVWGQAELNHAQAAQARSKAGDDGTTEPQFHDAADEGGAVAENQQPPEPPAAYDDRTGSAATAPQDGTPGGVGHPQYSDEEQAAMLKDLVDNGGPAPAPAAAGSAGPDVTLNRNA